MSRTDPTQLFVGAAQAAKPAAQPLPKCSQSGKDSGSIMIAIEAIAGKMRASRLPALPQERRCCDYRLLNSVDASSSTNAVASSQNAFGAATLR